MKTCLKEDFRKARRELAKIRTVQDALDGSDINLARLIAHRNRGGYLSGNLELMADMAEQFPNALRTSSNFGEMAGLGELDLLLGASGLSGVLGGAVTTNAMFAGWPMMRGIGSSIAAAKPKQYGSLQEWLLRGELLSSQGYGKEE